MTDLKTVTMTQQDINTALTMLKKIIKAGYIEIATESSQDLNANCYISSGDVEGVYFPNTILKETATSLKKHPSYNILALAKNEAGALGVVYALKDDIKQELKRFYNNIYIFETLDNLYYTYYEKEALSKLNNNIKELEKENYFLSMIKYQCKKDGGDFSQLEKNIKPDPANNINVKAVKESDTKLTIYFSESKTTKNGDKYNNYYNTTLYNYNGAFNSVEGLKKEIIKTVEANQYYINRYKNDIKNIKNIFKIVSIYKKHIGEITSTTEQELIKALQY